MTSFCPARTYWKKTVDSVPRVSTLIIRKCQKLRLSSISFGNQSKIRLYINYISKNGISVCVLLPVKVNSLKKCWKLLFLCWLSEVSGCQTKVINVDFFLHFQYVCLQIYVFFLPTAKDKLDWFYLTRTRSPRREGFLVLASDILKSKTEK